MLLSPPPFLVSGIAKAPISLARGKDALFLSLLPSSDASDFLLAASEVRGIPWDRWSPRCLTFYVRYSKENISQDICRVLDMAKETPQLLSIISSAMPWAFRAILQIWNRAQKKLKTRDRISISVWERNLRAKNEEEMWQKAFRYCVMKGTEWRHRTGDTACICSASSCPDSALLYLASVSALRHVLLEKVVKTQRLGRGKEY